MIAAVLLASLLLCGGIIGGVAYLATGPDTAVYTGNRVPARFHDTMKQVGALEPDEQILYFYSDAIRDIRDGFYFVSDRKVVVYADNSGKPLMRIRFGEILDADLYRNESFFGDSIITLELEGAPPCRSRCRANTTTTKSSSRRSPAVSSQQSECFRSEWRSAHPTRLVPARIIVTIQK